MTYTPKRVRETADRIMQAVSGAEEKGVDMLSVGIDRLYRWAMMLEQVAERDESEPIQRYMAKFTMAIPGEPIDEYIVRCEAHCDESNSATFGVVEVPNGSHPYIFGQFLPNPSMFSPVAEFENMKDATMYFARQCHIWVGSGKGVEPGVFHKPKDLPK